MEPNLGQYLFFLAVLVFLYVRLAPSAAPDIPMLNMIIPSETTRQIMAILVSLLVLGAALYVVLSHKYDASAEKWAFGSIGTIVGYWLKGK